MSISYSAGALEVLDVTVPQDDVSKRAKKGDLPLDSRAVALQSVNCLIIRNQPTNLSKWVGGLVIQFSEHGIWLAFVHFKRSLRVGPQFSSW